MNTLFNTNPVLDKRELATGCSRISTKVRSLMIIIFLLVSVTAFPQPAVIFVDTFTLINADTDQPVGDLVDGMVINQTDWGNTKFSVRATTSGVVDRVDFILAGPINHSQSEFILPYALFGDAPQGDYSGRQLLPGDYTLTAMPVSSVTRTAGRRVTFKVIPGTADVTTLFLVNAKTDRDIKELKDGDVVRLSETGKFLNARAAFAFGNISRVEFDLSGPISHHQVEVVSPYALFGDTNGNFNGRILKPGEYTLTVVAYVNGIKWSSRTIAFSVIDGYANTASVAKAQQLSVFPNPASSFLNVVSNENAEIMDLSIMDQNGNILIKANYGQRSNEQIDVSTLGKGVHYLRAKTADKIYSIRFVIE